MSWSAPEDWSRWDPDTLMICPYDEAHRIKAKRFQHHLMKCRQNHPDKDFVNCPFNAKHVMLRHDVRHHVSRCPDRSTIEQYNYKGSEKDEDGFYFKGNTSVPSYHRTEELQPSTENWDDQEADHSQLFHRVDRILPKHESFQSSDSTAVTDIQRLSPEEREKFKQQMRREALLRSSSSEVQLPSSLYNSSQGLSSQVENRGQRYSGTDNPIFGHSLEQSVTVSSSQQQVFHDSDLLRRGPMATSISTPKNPVFQHCLDNMKAQSRSLHENPVVCDKSIEQYSRQLAHGDSNSERPGVGNKSFSSQDTRKTSSSSSSLTNASEELENEIQSRLKLVTNKKPEFAPMNNVRGQPTSPKSTGVSSTHLAGVGRARLHAEARKKNFGGVSFSPPKTSGIGAAGSPPIGRGRGMLSFMYST